MSAVHGVRILEEQKSFLTSTFKTNNEHWAMTPETHKYAAAAGSFCFVTKENQYQQGHIQFDHNAVCTTIIVPQ